MFYVMDYVPGRVFADIDMPQCTPGERTALYSDAARVLGALHAVDYRAVGLEDFGSPSGYVARQVARWTSQYEASKVEDCEAMDRLCEWLQDNNPGDDIASIAHGDFRPGNLIYDNDEPRVVAVLDWELSTIGHPLGDVGYFLAPYRLRAEGNPFGLLGKDLDALGIPPEQSLLEIYADSAGRDTVPDIDFYIAFAMFRLAAILAGVMKRGLDGNAADPRAIERGRTYRQLAESAWAIADS